MSTWVGIIGVFFDLVAFLAWDYDRGSGQTTAWFWAAIGGFLTWFGFH